MRDDPEDEDGPQPGNLRDSNGVGGAGPGSPFVSLLGAVSEDVAQDRCRLRLTIRPEHLNSAGALHGGVIATLIDTAIARAAWNSGDGSAARRATIDLNVTYLRPIRHGTVAVEAWVLRRGRSIVNGEAEVFNDRGQMLAKGRATLAVSGEEDA